MEVAILASHILIFLKGNSFKVKLAEFFDKKRCEFLGKQRFLANNLIVGLTSSSQSKIPETISDPLKKNGFQEVIKHSHSNFVITACCILPQSNLHRSEYFTRCPIENVFGCFPCVQVTSHLICIRLVSVRSSLPCITIGVCIELTNL